MSKLILISGVSRSGKSTLAQKLQEDLPATFVIHQDEYVLPKELLPRIKDRIDWERPETIDWLELKKVITEAQSTNNYIIVEGIFTLSDLDTASAADYIISLKTDKSAFLKRRKMETRWGNEPDWFLEHVWENHLKFHNPHHIKSDIITDSQDSISYTNLLYQIRFL